MSLTVTQPLQAATAAPAQLVLRLHVNPERRVHALIAQMQEAARALPREYQEEVHGIIKGWEEQFFGLYQIDSPVDSAREDAAHALLFFRLNNIEYIMLNYAVGDTEKVKWLQVYNEIRSIVAEILPSHIDVETFIETDKQKQIEFKQRYQIDHAIGEVMQTVDALFAQLKLQLCEGVERVNRELQVKFESINKMLFELNSERKTATEELHGKVDTLTKLVAKIYQELERQLKETQDLREKARIHETALLHLLDECQAIIGRI